MKRSRALVLLAGLVLGGLFRAAGMAAAQEGAEMRWWVLAAGGGQAAGGEVRLNSTLGQPVVGTLSGGGAGLNSGYWYPGLEPTAVFLLSFTAEAQGDAILVAWQTGQEADTLGFNLYRADSPDGARTRLNEVLIAGQAPGSAHGAAYDWLDRWQLSSGQAYYYWLEDLDLHGAATLHGPVPAVAGNTAAPGWVYLPLAVRKR